MPRVTNPASQPQSLPRIAGSVKEAAAALGVSTRTVWPFIRSGQLRALRIGSRVVILYSDLIEFAEKRATRTGEHTRPDAAARMKAMNASRKKEVKE